MIDVVEYLETSLGIEAGVHSWPGEANLPLHLTSAADYSLCVVEGIGFLLARMKEGATLPECKRVHRGVSASTALPVVICARLDARQRHALARQGVPFIVPGLQIHMPFLGIVLASRTPFVSGGGKGSADGRRLSTRAQTAAIWAANRGGAVPLGKLRAASGMHASDASRAVDELAERGIAGKVREGRRVLYEIIGGQDRMLGEFLGLFASPVVQTILVRRESSLQAFPLAGESALAEWTDLTPPRIEVRAIMRRELRSLEIVETIEGEYPDEQMLRLQLWKTPPVFADSPDRRIDPISLGLSVRVDDERVEQALEQLFGKEYSWRNSTHSA